MLQLRRLLGSRNGASAIEFAIVAPLFILILMTLTAFGIYLSTAHSVQQIAADSARVAVAGLDAAERAALARGHIERATLDYPFIDPSLLVVEVSDDRQPGQFTVRLAYDARGLPIWNLFTFPLPSTEIERFSTIRIGGV